MDHLITVISFTYPHEAHLAKGKLQSEGVEVFIKDEMTTQVNNFYSNAIGGVKLQVRSADFDIAHSILIESGYIQEHAQKPNKLLIKLDRWTSVWPLIGRLPIELRVLISVALLLTVVVVTIVLMALP
ncbi:MAG: DUF2007 domain-containing protein [Bacteroidales bacterium]|nr:DUF2007 domain-containing protein [Bacteroidales bacterium]